MSKLKRFLLWTLPIFSTAFFYGLFYLISMVQFNVHIAPKAVPFDYFLQLVVAYTLYALSKRMTAFIVVHGLLMALLYIGNAIKISFFGGPIMPDDLFALRSLLLVLEGWYFLAAALPLAAIVSLLLFNFSLRHWGSYLACLVLILFGVTLVYKPAAILAPLDNKYGNSVWDQRSNYLWRGASVYSVQESARFFADADPPPDRDAALAAAERLRKNGPEATAADREFKPRNVHMIVLESFWDPNALPKAGYNQNPLAPAFRKLWKRAGDSTIMSPVFGGYTANAEFEALCGFPVVKDNVKFERQLLNNAPCLPHVLAEQGYRTLAAHPNVPVFWNRVNAYRRMGFKTYWSKSAFELDDMNSGFLADASLYRQVLEKLAALPDDGAPVFNYVLTYFGHWNYPLNKNRPSVITSPSAVAEVAAFANTVYYKTRELMAFLPQLQKQDPDSIIVIFGDHLPFLGENFAGYVESGVLAASRSEFTPEMFRYYVTTPLIIIDGQRGPLKLGSLPLYQIPGLLLDLMNYREPTIFEYTRSPPGLRIRPLPGLHLTLSDRSNIDVCYALTNTDTCAASQRWQQDVLTVSNDIFVGRQYTRPD